VAASALLGARRLVVRGGSGRAAAESPAGAGGGLPGGFFRPDLVGLFDRSVAVFVFPGSGLGLEVFSVEMMCSPGRG
jgi:hypothetical protein